MNESFLNIGIDTITKVKIVKVKIRVKNKIKLSFPRGLLGSKITLRNLLRRD